MFKKIKNILLHILLPRTCQSCKRDLGAHNAAPLCAQCLEELIILDKNFCARCGVLLKDGGAFCRSCRGTKAKKYKCGVVRSAFSFNGPVQSMIHNFKYHGHLYLKNFFAQHFYNAFARTKAFSDVNLIIPVPLHNLKQRMRGYNQAEILAAGLGERANIPVEKNLLKRKKFTRAQARLDKQNRQKNTQNAFEATAQVKGKIILLVDDVATTTFTLESCASALKKAGAKKVYALTLAREP